MGVAGETHGRMLAKPGGCGKAIRDKCNERHTMAIDGVDSISWASPPSDEHVCQRNLAGLLVKV
jgi:hypothetical protein